MSERALFINEPAAKAEADTLGLHLKEDRKYRPHEFRVGYRPVFSRGGIIGWGVCYQIHNGPWQWVEE